jgi:endonuclease/exonuclease/phosphatase family metal-dependent hydrolase
MSTPVKIVSFNIRGAWKGDGINSFPHRAGSILFKLDREQPDVVCFQEVSTRIADFLERHLPEYMLLYRGREVGMTGEGLAIAIRRATMELMSTDCFWLSETPYVPGSRFADQSNCPRVCQIALLRRKGDRDPFWVYNNHLDHISDQARILGIHQTMERVSEDQKKFAFPMFMLGDFNAGPGTETIRYCDEYADFPIVDLTRGCGSTFHNFGREERDEAEGHIDFIYVDKATAEKPHQITLWTDTKDGIYLTDHYPVCLTIEL